MKPGDKGEGIVVMDYTAYKMEMMHQLSDHSYYQVVNQDPTPHLMNVEKLPYRML